MKYFPFNVEKLKVLQIIKNETTIKQAAKKLYLSQPALSLQIQRLEYKVASSILDRKNRQIGFTVTGELILEYADKILKLSNEADKAIIYLKSLRKISLAIGSNEGLGRYLLPKIINLFSKYYSYAQLTLEIKSTHYLSWGVFNGKIDIGIIEEEEIPNELYNLLYVIPYLKEEIVLILPKSYDLKGVDSLTLENLYNFDFIGLNSGLIERKIIDKVLKKYNIDNERLKIKFELNSIDAIKRSVQAGLGVSFVSILAVKNELFSKRIQSVKVNGKKINKRLTIILNPKVYQPNILRKFYTHCFLILENNSYLNFLNLEN
uniref:putative RuBisCO transcriptional regulator n=1 Tax=Halosiphon tomentosus TaxID=64927 RepID=UPI002E76526F|nr:putative RuBisCO transcriptional regulator [Halosiphon tomentosus]WAM63731.1 putative RuBisCO transcriptional regulator [Halosiphon tomentosus]